MPKSSITIRTPAFRRVCIAWRVASKSSTTALSVISTSRRCAGSPVSFRTVRTESANLRSLSCDGEKLNDSETSSGQVTASRHASPKSCPDTMSNRPSSSARGIKVSGNINAAYWIVPPTQTLKANNPQRFQVNDGLIIRSNFIASDRCSQVLFQKRSLADVRIHLRIEEAVFSVSISGARKCDVGASEKLVNGNVTSACLCYPHACTDTMMLYADLDGFLNDLNERTRNFTCDFRIRTWQTHGKFVIANPREDVTRARAIAYARTHLQESLVTSKVSIHFIKLFELIEP